MSENDAIWENMRTEAEAAARKEPALASLFQEVVLDQNCLEEAIAVRLSRKLAYHATPEGYLKDTFCEVLSGTPEIGERIRHDITAIKERDPACRDMLSPLLYFKGFHAVTCYRVAHALWQEGREEFALYLQSLISEVFAVDIHPAARIGCGLLLDHATSFVAGETSVIENHVSILHEVTLGGTGKSKGDRHPKVRHNVLIGSGAKLLGNIEIGEGAKIGAGSVVVEDVPPHATVVGVPAVVVGFTKDLDPAESMDQRIC